MPADVPDAAGLLVASTKLEEYLKRYADDYVDSDDEGGSSSSEGPAQDEAAYTSCK